MKVLVTGCVGNIGREQVKQLIEAGHTVRGMDRIAKPKESDFEYLCGDLRDIYLLRKAVEGMDAVIHLGAIPSDRHGFADEVFSTNVQGTLNVLLASVEAGVERVINYSSINALGCVGGYKEAVEFPIDDFYPRHPYSPYQLSKHLGEEACTSFSNRHDLITISLRPMFVADPNHYGWFSEEHNRADGYAKVEYWAYVDRRDVCRAGMLALNVKGVKSDAFILSAIDTSVTVPTRELVERYYPNTPWRRDKEAYLAGHPYRALMDCHHSAEVLGWVPEYSWRDKKAEE